MVASSAAQSGSFKLPEHLDYFHDNVVAAFKSPTFDFDDFLDKEMNSTTTDCTVQNDQLTSKIKTQQKIDVTLKFASANVWNDYRNKGVAPHTTVNAFSSANFQKAINSAAAVPNAIAPQINNGKKRLHTAAISTSSSSRAEKRRERNRQNAKRSRFRRKVLENSLEQSISDLKKENQRLIKIVDSFPAKFSSNDNITSTAGSLVKVPQESFITALKQPRNKSLDEKTVSFLRSLRQR